MFGKGNRHLSARKEKETCLRRSNSGREKNVHRDSQGKKMTMLTACQQRTRIILGHGRYTGRARKKSWGNFFTTGREDGRFPGGIESAAFAEW